jgi:hypothetical protein
VFFLGSEHTKPAMTGLVRFSFFAMFYICVNHGSNYVLVCGKPCFKLYIHVNHVPTECFLFDFLCIYL